MRNRRDWPCKEVPRLGQFVEIIPHVTHNMNGDPIKNHWWEGQVFEVVGYKDYLTSYSGGGKRSLPKTNWGELILRYSKYNYQGLLEHDNFYMEIEHCKVISARPLLYKPEQLRQVSQWWQVPDARFYVFAHDEAMSGWGESVNRNSEPMESWCIFPCDSVQDAHRVLANLRSRPEMTSVGVSRFLDHSGPTNKLCNERDRYSGLVYKKINQNQRMSKYNKEVDWEKTHVNGAHFFTGYGNDFHVTLMPKSECPNWYLPNMGRSPAEIKEQKSRRTITAFREQMASLVRVMEDVAT